MTGRSVLNGFQRTDIPFKNLLLTGSWQTMPGGKTNANGFVSDSSFTSSAGTVYLPTNYFGSYRFHWDGAARIDPGGLPTLVTAGGANFSGGRFNGTLPAAPNNFVEYSIAANILNVTDSGVPSSAGGNMVLVTTAAANSITPNICRVAGVGGVPAANGDWTYLANQILTVGGTAHVGDVLTLNVTPVVPGGGTLTPITYTLVDGDTLQSAAAAIVALVNANAYLASKNVFAGAATAGVFDIYSPAATLAASVTGSGATTTFVRSSSNARYCLVGSTFSGAFTSGGTITFSPTQVTFTLMNSGTFNSSFGNMILCMAGTTSLGTSHVNDLDDCLSGDLSRMFNQDFIDLYSGLNIGVLRLLDVAGINNSNQTRSAYSTPVGYISYGSSRFFPDVWCGGNGASLPNVTSSAAGLAYACPAATDTPASWTDGEVFQGILDAVPATTAITGAANNGSGLIRLRAADLSGFTTGQRVAVAPYNAAAGYAAGNGKGTWTITKGNDGADYIDLTSDKAGNPSVFENAWSSGGSISAATIDCGSRGAKLLLGVDGTHPSVGNSFSTTLNVTFVYNAALDGVIVSSSSSNAGITPAWPLEVRVALCNKLGVHFWHQFPQSYDLDSVSAETTYIAANLNEGLDGYFERGNEEWNAAFYTTGLSYHIAKCFNASNAVTFGQISWVALQHRLFMGAVTTAWGERSGLNRVLPWQGANWNSSVQTLLYNGGNLNGSTFPLYATAGYADYDTAPNRPADYTEAFSYAPYYSGAVLGPHGPNGTLSAIDISGLTDAADNFAAGNVAAAFAWIDHDIRKGTKNTKAIASVSGGTTFNITAHGFANTNRMAFSLAEGGEFYTGGIPSIDQSYYVVNATTDSFQLSLTSGGAAITGITGGSGVRIGVLGAEPLLLCKEKYYPGYATAAASYSPAKKIVCYESGFQGGPAITFGQCDTYGISRSYGGTDTGTFGYGGSVYDMLLAYKKSAEFSLTVTKQWNDQRDAQVAAGGLADDLWPAWYVSSGSSLTSINTSDGCSISANYPWAMIPTDIYGTPQAFQSFDSMRLFNDRKRRFILRG